MNKNFTINYPNVNSVNIIKGTDAILIEQEIDSMFEEIWKVIKDDLMTKINNCYISNENEKVKLKQQFNDMKNFIKEKLIKALKLSSQGIVTIIWSLRVNPDTIKSELEIIVLYMDIKTLLSGTIETVWKKA